MPTVETPSAAAVRAVANSSNAFGFDLYARVAEAPGNLAISPASITTALAMAWGGAKYQTDEQMKKVLHVDGERDAAIAAWGNLSRALQEPSRPLKLRIANRLFGEKTFTLEQPFLDKTQAAFGAPLEPVDFRGAPGAARQMINSWVEARTEDRIKDLLPSSAITSDTRMVLVNAIYFIAEWLTRFEMEQTFDAPFTTDGGTKKVPTMHNALPVKMAQVDGAKMLELPYKGGDTVMYVVLPDTVDGLTALENSINAKSLESWTSALAMQRVDVALPRFKIEPSAPFLLSTELKALGMPIAFDPENADFSGIGVPPEAKNRLYLSEAFHKAFVKVDERGTEAAAATAVIWGTLSMAMPSTAAKFHADHPFLFVIVDRPSGLVLFMGRVSDPSVS